MTIVASVLAAVAGPRHLGIGAGAEPPTGGPQEPTGTDTTPTTTSPTGGQQPTTTTASSPHRPGRAPDFALGAGLLLAGSRPGADRLKAVVQRVRRRNTEVALREALEPIRAARLSPRRPDPDMGPLHVEPSTPPPAA